MKKLQDTLYKTRNYQYILTKIIVEKNCLTVLGHSEFDKAGKDIVCAAISSLVCGAANIWDKNKNVSINYSEKDAFVKFEVKKDEKIKIEMDFLKNLLKILVKNYPKNVEYIER